MRAMWLVAGREFKTRITSKLFLILSGLSLILLVGGPVVLATFLDRDAAQPPEVPVVDRSGILLPLLEQSLNQAVAAGAPERLRLKPASPADETTLLEQAKEGQITAVIILHGAGPADLTAEVHSSSGITLGQVAEPLRSAMQGVKQSLLLEQGLVSQDVVALLLAPPNIRAVQLTTGTTDGAAFAMRTTVANLFNMLMYMGILIYAALIFTGVLEEKTSRVMEVMIASVHPTAMLAGKVLGIGLVGLLQFALWILSYFLVLSIPVVTESEQMGPFVDALRSVDPSFMIYMLTYFVLGFFLYASLNAAAGSTISRMEDSAGVQTPISLLVVAGYMVSIFAMSNPAGAVARWASMVPFFSPYVMISRLALGSPPAWEVALSIGLLAATTVLVTWLAARVYRMGVLLYGTRPSVKVIWQALRKG